MNFDNAVKNLVQSEENFVMPETVITDYFDTVLQSIEIAFEEILKSDLSIERQEIEHLKDTVNAICWEVVHDEHLKNELRSEAKFFVVNDDEAGYVEYVKNKLHRIHFFIVYRNKNRVQLFDFAGFPEPADLLALLQRKIMATWWAERPAVCQIKFEDVVNVERLHLSRLDLSKMDQSMLENFKNLTSLTIFWGDNGKCAEIPSGLFSPLKKLDHLSFRGTTNLSRLPTDSFVYLKNLKSFDFSFNSLRDIQPGAFSGLNGLIELNLRDNHIETIQKGAFASLDTLNSLCLVGNSISLLEDGCFEELKVLTQLHLRKNSIHELKRLTFSGLENLSTLNLRCNNIYNLDDECFAPLKNLEHLFLDKNKISSLSPKTFLGLTNLKCLDLNRNRLVILNPRTFRPLKQLRVLSLRRNRLRVIQSYLFAELINLEYLYLQKNAIDEIQPLAFEGLDNIKEICWIK